MCLLYFNIYPEKVGGNHNASIKRCEFIINEFNKFKYEWILINIE